ncbi:hypothetical protein Ddye_030540 [Dipteronia dyeriana]|uniref:Uncharacterized protein n=1 Tax=Dipteronia dyeriana TaxID=168575 RepID=A0AAD9WMT8_9ROSI|nr:hypothetical protein Ddye_030540 [Dipteronia dyeriana]
MWKFINDKSRVREFVGIPRVKHPPVNPSCIAGEGMGAAITRGFKPAHEPGDLRGFKGGRGLHLLSQPSSSSAKRIHTHSSSEKCLSMVGEGSTSNLNQSGLLSVLRMWYHIPLDCIYHTRNFKNEEVRNLFVGKDHVGDVTLSKKILAALTTDLRRFVELNTTHRVRRWRDLAETTNNIVEEEKK